jgi:pyruvate/2-oxoglutarate dehydrogenase complex dihydrolipoamide dehydrogenase (E3) component
MKEFDAIIIGAGQAGPALAGRLTVAGMTAALVERKLFGGMCVNTGCTPTKTMVASAYAAHLARRAADFGVLLEGPARVDMKRVKARADAVVANSRRGVEKWLRGMNGCTVVEGHARFESADRVRVGEELLTAPRVFINVGGRAFVPDMPGVGEVPFLINRSMLELDCLPRRGAVGHPLRAARQVLQRPGAGDERPAGRLHLGDSRVSRRRRTRRTAFQAPARTRRKTDGRARLLNQNKSDDQVRRPDARR